MLENTYIPAKIIRTYHSKNKIPNKVYDNIQQYAPNLEHIVYDDNECIDFLKENYDLEVAEAFKTLSYPPHKADLFRYCYLHKYGGIYFDIKTILLKPINEIFYRNLNYTVIWLNTIHQGIIASKRNNPIFINLIEHILANKRTNQNMLFIYYMYEELKRQLEIEKINRGLNINNKNYNQSWYLFEEVGFPKEDCENKLDRYGMCDFVVDEKNNKFFKTRWYDFPNGKDWN